MQVSITGDKVETQFMKCKRRSHRLLSHRHERSFIPLVSRPDHHTLHESIQCSLCTNDHVVWHLFESWVRGENHDDHVCYEWVCFWTKGSPVVVDHSYASWILRILLAYVSAVQVFWAEIWLNLRKSEGKEFLSLTMIHVRTVVPEATLERTRQRK